MRAAALLSLPAAVLGSQCTSPVIAGVLSYKDEGVAKETFIVNKQGSGVTVSGSSVTVEHGPRIYFGSKCAAKMEQDMFLSLPLLGRTLSYTVDVSAVGCACNAALYMVAMPAADPTECGDYYCDANKVCGVNCVEMDVQECNNHAWATTPHSAYDGGGCSKRARPYGTSGGIDTSKPFRVNMYFEKAKNGTGIERISTSLRQSGVSVNITHDGSCGKNLYDVGTAVEKGMVVTVSNWGSSASTMKWLDSDVCGTESCNRGAFTFSDVEVVTGAA
eukprot:TRINITY_DN2766_c0_g1_i1.p1 TRINITY_DN2766_c0_g1~~TRINITY_DN2766_c0_g1_i1.p1  ORF type:complete len:297 (+),score=119.70 TRINITY_DN2766_c0_g1_i1:69-893(+)